MGFSLKSAISGATGGFSTGGLFGAGLGAITGGLIGGAEESQANAVYKRQMADSINLWNMQNAYNSPLQQMLRFDEAGLNRMLVYGSGNVSGNASSSVNSPSYPQISGDYSKSIARMFERLNVEEKQEDVAGKELDNEMKRAQLGLTLARIQALKAGRTVGNSTNADLQRELLQLRIAALKNPPKKDERGWFERRMDDLLEVGGRIGEGIFDFVDRPSLENPNVRVIY